MSFVNRLSDLHSMAQAMHHERVGMWEISQYRIPLGLQLLGQCDAASEFLKAALSDLGSREDAAARRYRLFAERALSGANYLGPQPETP